MIQELMVTIKQLVRRVSVLESQIELPDISIFIAASGAFKPASLADASAENNTIYYSTTAAKLVYKDGAGTVNNLY